MHLQVSDRLFETTEKGPIARLKNWVQAASRRRRARMFFDILKPDPHASVLDLGGGRGRHLARFYPGLKNVCIGDYNRTALDYAARSFAYKTLPLDGTSRLPVADRSFDIIFCSSVIEHVTGPKADAVALFKRDGPAFRQQALVYQRAFADEIRRCSKRYFVQTPARYFPVEVHSWIPLLGYLRTDMQWQVIKVFNRFWPRKDECPDWCLLTGRQMAELFPDATIHRERVFGITKSYIAIRNGG